MNSVYRIERKDLPRAVADQRSCRFPRRIQIPNAAHGDDYIFRFGSVFRPNQGGILPREGGAILFGKAAKGIDPCVYRQPLSVGARQENGEGVIIKGSADPTRGVAGGRKEGGGIKAVAVGTNLHEKGVDPDGDDVFQQLLHAADIV